MPNPDFVVRARCPGCRATRCAPLYSCPLSAPPVRDYLESFYAPQGRIEFEYLAGAEYVLDECSECGLIFQRDIPNDALMRKLYEAWIDPARVFELRERSRRLAAYLQDAGEIAMVIAYFGVAPSQLTFLDVGMGWGDWCRMARAFGCECYGTELSAARVRHAESHGVPVLAGHEIRQHRFDLIRAEQVFEHLPDPLDALVDLAGALNLGGLVKLGVPDGRDIKRRLRVLDWTAPKGSRNSLNPLSPLEHINCFRHESLVKMAELSGLAPIDIPLRIQYAYGLLWAPLMRLPDRLWAPLKRRLLRRGTSLFFRRASGRAGPAP